MKFKTSFFLLLCFFCNIGVAAELTNLTVKQLAQLQEKQNALVVDIRTEREWEQTGIIPGSHKLQFFAADGQYNAEKWLSDLEQLKSSPEQPLILVCRSGNRSSLVGNMLSKQKQIKNIHHLSNGIQSWIKLGNPILQQ